MKNQPFYKEAKLMLETIPAVATENCFALKGGTAINFLVRDMPRLSVDIDLTYLPIEDRATSLANISSALKRISNRIAQADPNARIQEGLIKNTKIVSKLYVSNHEAQIIIEPNLVLRGTAFPTKKRTLSPAVKSLFELSVSIETASSGDLYGGKLCAALDRQHPRDLFDVQVLLENEGITDEIRTGFLIYLAGHDETMSDLLSPKKKDIRDQFFTEFSGMTNRETTLEELEKTRDRLFKMFPEILAENERRFLLSLKEGQPRWDLLPIQGAEKLPAIQWKLLNIRKMKPEHHSKSVKRLKAILGL